MKKLKIKDVIMIALLSALYMVFYMLSMVIIAPLGPFGHSISCGICALLTGSIFFFISRKIGKFGQFMLMQAICMVLFSIMGAGYLPWLVTSMVGALIADFIASKDNNQHVFKVALASGIFHVGQAWGAIIPSWFFLDSYREEWISRGQTPEAMDEMIKYTSGAMGVVSTVIVFALSVAGVYLGYAILRKHLEKKDIAMA
ncbi:energy-coupling factor transport system substrate-specific component [Pseudobutyrivibrio sp. YE44]|uniref:MptD family putative ECF transporter S component n=1 Tax=Pseudobutyrivibrio sp. YE44 TaxID=1520802 RepID=UPI000889B909|nr:MptD family putative ECF transporter S component [Pseudobutyrivibrio sp. YE44]SDB33441.1 energy-coupling factor transport system substrate-specific component [Pseudobutyrivibrio sp. YE44]